MHLLHTAWLLEGKNEPLSLQWVQVDALPQQGGGAHRDRHPGFSPDCQTRKDGTVPS